MNVLILLPQFIDRAGREVYHIHEADDECRTLRAGKKVGMIRIHPTEDIAVQFERIGNQVEAHGTG